MSASRGLPSWAQRDAVRYIFDAAKRLGGEARIVGGAVRDWLAGCNVSEIDMAVNLPIQAIANELQRNQCLKVIYTGLDHGTVTVVSGKDRIEVTQTRSDDEPDGRHALVRFQDDWVTDAARRDFTINAIYLNADGQVFDPLNGQTDLAARRLRFVGKAADRVQEDALRMLRYCRFSIDYSDGNHDKEAIDALTSFAVLSERLSGERVTQELQKILSHERCASAIDLLHKTGLDKASLGCDIVVSSSPLSPLDLRLVRASSGWLVLLVAIIPQADVTMVLERLRLSRAEQKFCEQLAQSNAAQIFAQLTALNWRQSAFFMKRRSAAFYACAAWRLGKALDRQHYRTLFQWRPPKLPVSGADLLSHGVDKGQALGQMLYKAEKLWVESDFTMTKSALLAVVVK
jgi:poly(A) polymerase